MYNIIDLFSGCGGMSWGLHQAAPEHFKVLAAVDIDAKALATFARNHASAITFKPARMARSC